jgi:hypothetical protein
MTQRLLVAWQAVAPPPGQRPGEMVVAVCAVGAVFRRLIGISSFPP